MTRSITSIGNGEVGPDSSSDVEMFSGPICSVRSTLDSSSSVSIASLNESKSSPDEDCTGLDEAGLLGAKDSVSDLDSESESRGSRRGTFGRFRVGGRRNPLGRFRGDLTSEGRKPGQQQPESIGKGGHMLHFPLLVGGGLRHVAWI